MTKKTKMAIFLVGLSGGAGKVVVNYFRNMPDNYQIDIVTMHVESKKLLKQYSELGMNVIKIPSKKDSFFSNLYSMYKILKKGHYDVAYAHMTLTNFFPLYIAKLCNVKLRISHSHLAPQRKSFFEKVLALLTNEVLTDRIACGKNAGEFLYGKRKFKILPNAVDLDKFKFNRDIRSKLRDNLQIPEDGFVIGHVGRFDKQKNHSFIIKLFKEVIKKQKNAFLVLIGEGHLRADIEKQVERYGLNNRVKFIGQIDNVYDYLNVFDTFILPSLFEGLSVSAIEAQANGLPCIFSTTVSKETAITKNAYFIDLNDENQWVNKLLKVKRVNNKIIKEQITNKGYEIKNEASKFNDWLEKRVRQVNGLS